jgi:hypothetical protein
MRQDTAIYATILDGADVLNHPLQAGRQAYVQVARGSVTRQRLHLAGGRCGARER